MFGDGVVVGASGVEGEGLEGTRLTGGVEGDFVISVAREDEGEVGVVVAGDFVGDSFGYPDGGGSGALGAVGVFDLGVSFGDGGGVFAVGFDDAQGAVAVVGGGDGEGEDFVVGKWEDARVVVGGFGDFVSPGAFIGDVELPAGGEDGGGGGADSGGGGVGASGGGFFGEGEVEAVDVG